jgi:hypothetical protein
MPQAYGPAAGLAHHGKGLWQNFFKNLIADNLYFFFNALFFFQRLLCPFFSSAVKSRL